jgi:hypothetical protein
LRRRTGRPEKLKDRKIAIAVLTGNRWRMVQRMIRKIVVAVDAAEPGSYAVIQFPVVPARG